MMAISTRPRRCCWTNSQRNSIRSANLAWLRGIRLPLAIMILLIGASAWAQDLGPGLYKGDVKVLDFEEILLESVRQQGDPLLRESRALELFDAITSRAPADRSRAWGDYISLLLRCQDILAEREGSNRGDSASELLVAELLELEKALADAEVALREHLLDLEIHLASRQSTAVKLPHLRELTEQWRAEGAALLAIFSNLRAQHEAGNWFGAQSAQGDLADWFEEHGLSQPEFPLPDGARPLPMEVREPGVQRGNAARIAYPRGGRDYDPDDLLETVDVQFSPEIVALADSLDRSPVDIYYFVRDNFTFEPYLGSRKGSAQTLKHRRGNDYDQASLLIALLRSAGVPARYASGTARMPVDRATNWLGMPDKRNAGSLLATAGMEGTLWISGPDTTAVSCKRVWAEAWIPFANYRGAVNDSTGFMWVPLDPVFKQYEYETAYNLPAEIGFDAEAFVDDYISSFKVEPPSEIFEQLLLAELPNHHPGAELADLKPRRQVITEPDGILPGTLAYELLSYDGSFSEIPSDMRYQIRFHVYGGGTDLDYSTTLPEIVLKQVTLSYEGATAGDQQLIDDAGGIFNVTDPYLINLVPLLKIDGCEVARGSGAIMMGITHNSDMHFTAPSGASNQIPVVGNVITAGNYQGLGIDTEDAIPAFFDVVETACPEDLLGEELHQTALTYLNLVDSAGDEMADYLHLVVINDVSEAIVENAVTVYFNGSTPISFDWTGMIVDADRKIIGPFARDGQMEPCQFMRLGGADGSSQENRVFEERFGEEAISAMKILGLAADSLINVCRITSSIAADCPGIDQPSHVINAINSALAQGHHVIIPERQFTYYEWTGTAWIDIDPVTCAAGYIISGGHNGGATVQEWLIWYPGLACLYPYGDIEVEPLGMGANNDLFSADSFDHWTFIANDLRYLSKNSGDNPCSVLYTADQRFTVRYSITQLANDPRFGPGEYTFKVGDPGECASCQRKELKVTIFKVDLKEVAFGGPSYHIVRKDDDSGNYSTPHWQDNSSPLDRDAEDTGDKKYPVSYTRNTKPRLDVKIALEPSLPSVPVRVRGEGTGILDVPETPGSMSGDYIILNGVETTGAFVNAVGYMNSLTVIWSVSVDGGSTWIDVGSSSNEVFVTVGTPACTKPFRTVMYLACKHTGGTDASSCLTNTWASFSGPANVNAWNEASKSYSRPLHYYQNSSGNNNTVTSQLLADANGQCHSWAHMFKECLLVNNVTSQRVRVLPLTGYSGFGVKNITFDSNPDYPAFDPWMYSTMDLDISATGIPGQNESTPKAKLFAQHFIVLPTGASTYYDPSYGVVASGASTYTTMAVDAWSAYLGGGMKWRKASSSPPAVLIFQSGSW